MILIKKIDVEKHFAARRAARLGRMGPASQFGAAGTKSAAKKKSVPCLGRYSPFGNNLLRAYPLPRLRSRPILVETDC